MGEGTTSITARIVDGNPGSGAFTLMGGDPGSPIWDDYLAAVKDEYRPHFTAIRNAVENSRWNGATGEQFCNDHFFRCSDGTEIAFTWRAWGDLMQAIVGKREGYMRYYM